MTGKNHRKYAKLTIAILLSAIFLQFMTINTGKFDAEYTQCISTAANATPARLVPVGMTAGVRFFTEGIMVLAVAPFEGEGGASAMPAGGILQVGDIIMKANDKIVITQEDLIRIIENTKPTTPVRLEIRRNGGAMDVEIFPKNDSEGSAKIGCWVRDSTQGIGTITYFDPETGKFAALGHGISDIDTRRLMTLRVGHIFETDIVDIKKGKKGDPGEIIGEIDEQTIIGSISKNTELGIYGEIAPTYTALPTEAIPIATREEIRIGPAIIRTDIEGEGIRDYEIYIESINRDTSELSKGLILRITDEGLITRTNGIVQGMSGSPILQNNKLIGAVTHVIVRCYPKKIHSNYPSFLPMTNKNISLTLLF